MAFSIINLSAHNAQTVSRRYGLWVALVNAWIIIASPAWAEQVNIIAIGDSLTAGYGLAQSDSFPAQLQAALRAVGEEVRIINSGVSGDTSAGGRARLEWALSLKPDAVILELGANDGLRGLDPGQTEANLNEMITKIRTQALPVLLTGMLAPPNLGQEYSNEFNSLFQRLANKHGVLFYPFFLEGVVAVPALNQTDGIHPNAAGVAEIVKRILPPVRELIGQVR